VTIRDFQRFANSSWLNDDNINSILRSLAYVQLPEVNSQDGASPHRVLRVRDEGQGPVIHFLSSFFFTMLTSGGDPGMTTVSDFVQDMDIFHLYNYDAVRRQMRSPTVVRSGRGSNLNIFLDVGFVFMPVNLTTSHWLCVVVNTGSYSVRSNRAVTPGHIYIYDFLGGIDPILYRYIVAVVRKWIRDEIARVEINLDPTDWGVTYILENWQRDTFTCGDRILVVAWLLTLTGTAPAAHELEGIMRSATEMSRIRTWFATTMFNDSLWLPNMLGHEQLDEWMLGQEPL
jgi:Ulp1 family protease